MEGFEYKDIFATKAIEYVIILAFLVLLVLFFRFLNKQAKGAKTSQPSRETHISLIDFFTIAAGYYYHLGHAWIKTEKNELVWVGMDDFAQKLLGKINEFVLPKPGTLLVQGESGWKVKIAGKEIDIISPISGEVQEANEPLIDHPEKLSPDNFADSWLLKVKASKLESSINNLFSGNLATAWLNETVKQLQEEIEGHLGRDFSVEQIGNKGFARLLDEKNWVSVAEKFLKPPRR